MAPPALIPIAPAAAMVAGPFLDSIRISPSCAITLYAPFITFKLYPLAGHVTFTKGERSEVATLASKIL